MSFYMNFGAINEGEQADAYKKRKADEKVAKDTKEKESFERRWPAIDGNEDRTRDPGYKARHYFVDDDPKRPTKSIHPDDEKKHIDDCKRADKAYEKFWKEKDRRFDQQDPNFSNISKEKGFNAIDAINRHMRRHPEAYKEYGIFAETCFIN